MNTYSFRTASQALPSLATAVLDHGYEHGSRNGVVKELLNPQVVIEDPVRREILTVNRKANVFAQIAETCWVLAGRNDVEWLSAYLPRAMDYSDDGKVWRGGYGPRIRGGYFGFDQLEHTLDILREDPLSRRAVMAIYEPTTDASPGKDIPCNDFLQFQSRLGELHLTVTVRSNDLMWGWSGINAFEWSVLQEIAARLLGIGVGTLTFNIGNLHLYAPHWEKASRLVYEDHAVSIPTIPFDPTRSITSLVQVDHLLERWFYWEGLCRTGEATLEGLSEWKEPLFRSWAAAIAYYWSRRDEWLINLQGTALHAAIGQTPVSVYPAPVQRSSGARVGVGATGRPRENARAFYEYTAKLHATKHASYGDSWKKRGEKMSILANMARKVDRLGVGDEFDSSADTVIDLLVYAIKYRCWLVDVDANPVNVNADLDYYLGETLERTAEHNWQKRISEEFDYYADRVDYLDMTTKVEFVEKLIVRLTPIARDLWCEERNNEYRGADVD